MRILLDTDILIDVTLDRKPFSNYSSHVFNLSESRQIKSFVAWHSISNFYYLVRPKTSGIKAREFIIDLLRFNEIAPVSTKDAIFATSLNLPDFEDSLQVASARACRAELILTRNVKHYTKSPIPARTPKEFIEDFKIDDRYF